MATVAKIVCILVAFMMAIAPAAEAAIQCNLVSLDLMYCSSYLKGGPSPIPRCCAGVRLLNNIARIPQDRQTVCGCLKSYVSSISGLNEANAAALPGKCGVDIPYPISPKIDCSKVH